MYCHTNEKIVPVPFDTILACMDRQKNAISKPRVNSMDEYLCTIKTNKIFCLTRAINYIS